MDYRIKEILVRIEKDISQPLAIPDLAASINLSVSYFQHLFKKETQTSFIKYVNQLRLEKARKLLETTHLRVKEIRFEVGVTNEAHFMGNFKSKFGKTANDYRKAFRNAENCSK